MSTNGRLALSELTPIEGGFLRADAAAAYYVFRIILHQLSGRWCTWTKLDGLYRTYDRQVYWKAYWTARGLPGNASTPGFSNHGWGLAVDIYNVFLYNREHLREAARQTGFVFDVPSEAWHMRFVGGVTLPALGSATPIKLSKRRDTTVYFERNVQGTVFLSTEIGSAPIAQPSHLALFQRDFAAYPGWDTQLDVERDIKQSYKNAANSGIYNAIQRGVDNVNTHIKQFTDPILAKVQPVDAKALGVAVATAVATELARIGVKVDYAQIGSVVEQTLTDNFAAVAAGAKAQTDLFLSEMSKVGTIDEKSIASAISANIAASGVSVSDEVAGTIAGAVRREIAPDLVRLELKNQLIQ